LIDPGKFAIIDRSETQLVFTITILSGGISMRENITLACTETGDRNYISTKNKRNNPERIELMKYSPRLRRHTLHRETR